MGDFEGSYRPSGCKLQVAGYMRDHEVSHRSLSFATCNMHLATMQPATCNTNIKIYEFIRLHHND